MSDDPRTALPPDLRSSLLAEACALADVCARSIAATRREGLGIEVKPDTSLVTTADVNAEQAFRLAVAEQHPDHGVLGEEGGMSKPDAPFRWVIDPIDGTAEFARGIATYGTIIGLFYADLPLVGVIDHAALGLRVSGAHGVGTFANGKPVVLAPADPAGTGATGPRIGLPSRAGFVRRGDFGEVFEVLTRAYPECRTYHTCLSHACALTGALDAAVEWDVPIWDLGALEMLAAEAGAAFHTVLRRRHVDGTELLSVAFGRPQVADDLAIRIRRCLERRSAATC